MASKGKSSHNQKKHTEGQGANTTKEDQQVGTYHTITSQPNPAPLQSKKAKNGWYETLPWWKILEGAGIAAGIVYTVITLATLFEVEKQSKISHDALVTSQRPWLGAETVPTVFNSLIRPQVPNTPLFASGPDLQDPDVNISIFNYGNSPALKIGIHLQPYFMTNEIAGGKDSYRKDYEEAAESVCRLADAYRQEFGSLGGGEYIFPNHSTRRQFKYNFPTIRQELIETAPLVLVGCVRYADQFNGDHTTRLCFIDESAKPVAQFRAGDKLVSCNLGSAIN